MKASVVIPARYGSTRFPGKLLADLEGRPVLWHTWQAVKKMTMVAEIIIAVDNEILLKAVRSWGGTAILTKPDCTSGMERIASIIDSLKSELILNVQGDEPFVDSKLLDNLVRDSLNHQADIITPVFKIHSIEQLLSPHLVKVAITAKNRALYFSRSVIPFVRDIPQKEWMEAHTFFGHIGVYCSKRHVLQNYKQLPPSLLEKAENLEQLKFMDYGYTIQVVHTNSHTIGIDTPQDLEIAKQFLRQRYT